MTFRRMAVGVVLRGRVARAVSAGSMMPRITRRNPSTAGPPASQIGGGEALALAIE